MKRLLAPMFLVLIAVLGILAIFLSVRGQSPRDAALSRYLAYFAAHTNGLSVGSVVQATNPTRFTADMSGPVVGSSTYYHTDIPYQDGGSNDGPRPLPYPSRDITCVMLTGRDGQQWVVFVVLHEDLYNAEWLVHQSRTPWPSDDLRMLLDTIGCSLSGK